MKTHAILLVGLLLLCASPSWAAVTVTPPAGAEGTLPPVGSEGDCLLVSSGEPVWGACPGAGSGAPTDATYITQTANGTLSDEQALGSLSTGCVSVTTTTGVLNSRTLTGTANQIAVANGDCSGAPTFSIPNNPTLPGTTTGTFSGNLTGNASTATALASNPSDCGANEFATSIAASGNLGCAQPAVGDVSGLGSGVGTFLATPSSANLASALTNETGSGAAVFGTSPTIEAGVLTTKVRLPIVTALPGSPSDGDTVVVTDDSAVGACDSNAGSARTICQWDGTTWLAIGDGGSAGATPTLDAVCGAGCNYDGANSFANGLRVNDGTNGSRLYTDATSGPQIVCDIGGTENDCDYFRKLNAGKKWGVKDRDGTEIFTLTEADNSGALTNVTLNAESSGNTITIPDERHFVVATCQNATPSPNFDIPTSNGPAATCDTGTNTQKGYLAFDASTDESFQDHWILPTGFTGAIDMHFRWKASSTSGAVGWCAQLIRVPDASTSDPAFPAQASGNCVSDTAKGTTLQENTATISGVTCTSCAAGDHVYVRISRDADGGAVTDDMTGDALLLTYGRTIRVAL